MFFQDYQNTGWIYHIIHITNLKKTLTEGIHYNDKISYENHYEKFHDFIDSLKTKNIPPWVIRKKAIFATINYRDNPCFHSHTAVLALKADKSKCWVANENRANQIYEPFILKEMEEFKGAKDYLNTKGRNLIKEYWETSLSFEDNIKERRDLVKGYDAEVMIFDSIPPEDIQLLYLTSDHRTLTVKEWKKIFCGE
ncbi:hypothetical protein [Natronincola ferrireducens]|uniref:DarT domain-containing protein n=1 Tax=Natronincola ferrireducens TaxID=393762 RepID=A0A1G8Y654_9FIRM|nr:hypothetical protein [Natronincola ferrireducens]SDJ98117.1 hypothetical protein SAMN05660472_00433 [Natronincola ferrireducens]